jgi:hypothetical protein
MLQPHEGISPNQGSTLSPWKNALFSLAALFLLMGFAYSYTPDSWQERVIVGLSKVATGERVIHDISAGEASDILYKFFNVKVTCTEPTERMWLQYCQNLYMENTAIDCNAVSSKDKAFVMGNMRVCKVAR